MLSLPIFFSSTPSVLSLSPNPSRPRPRHLPFSSTTNTTQPSPDEQPVPVHNLAGHRLEETVESGSARSRIDSWISSRIPRASRARIQASIRSGLVSVNGSTVAKASHMIKGGDSVRCVVSELQPLSAEPEDIPLDVVYEDNHVLVVNKPAHMVVHPAPGNPNGTLVNAVLHHCRLPPIELAANDILSGLEDASESSDSDLDSIFSGKHFNSEASIRPGIVHRLDKGTSGLLVVAKDEHSHARLSEQFKSHTIHRVYISLTSGVPSQNQARIDVPIARDPNNRIRMAAVSGPNKNRYARHAASRYKVLEILAAGGSALVQWRLETGRTHQIRAHAKYLGIPLLGDEVYGGSKNLALSLLKPKAPVTYHGQLSQMLSKLERPCLHAFSLGFKHPHTGEDVKFSCPPPVDFAEILTQLRNISSKKDDQVGSLKRGANFLFSSIKRPYDSFYEADTRLIPKPTPT